jgi:hypothetical protein
MAIIQTPDALKLGGIILLNYLLLSWCNATVTSFTIVVMIINGHNRFSVLCHLSTWAQCNFESVRSLKSQLSNHPVNSHICLTLQLSPWTRFWLAGVCVRYMAVESDWWRSWSFLSRESHTALFRWQVKFFSLCNLTRDALGANSSPLTTLDVQVTIGSWHVC